MVNVSKLKASTFFAQLEKFCLYMLLHRCSRASWSPFFSEVSLSETHLTIPYPFTVALPQMKMNPQGE